MLLDPCLAQCLAQERIKEALREAEQERLSSSRAWELRLLATLFVGALLISILLLL